MIGYYGILFVMTLLGSVASLFLKKASDSKGILEMIKNINLYIGGFLYLSSALLNIVVLRYLEYSIVLPLTSITYIWTMFFAYLILKERITIKKAWGIMLIIIGGIMLAK